MKICLLFFTGLLWTSLTILPISAQSIRQEKCREYQKNLNDLREVDVRLEIMRAKLTDENPLIKALRKEQGRLFKLIQKKEPYYSSSKCILPNSSTSEPVMGLW